MNVVVVCDGVASIFAFGRRRRSVFGRRIERWRKSIFAAVVVGPEIWEWREESERSAVRNGGPSPATECEESISRVKPYARRGFGCRPSGEKRVRSPCKWPVELRGPVNAYGASVGAPGDQRSSGRPRNENTALSRRTVGDRWGVTTREYGPRAVSLPSTRITFVVINYGRWWSPPHRRVVRDTRGDPTTDRPNFKTLGLDAHRGAPPIVEWGQVGDMSSAGIGVKIKGGR